MNLYKNSEIIEKNESRGQKILRNAALPFNTYCNWFYVYILRLQVGKPYNEK